MEEKYKDYRPKFAHQEFLWMMLFDLRTPTLTIDGFSEILAKGDDGPLSPKQVSNVDIIRKSSRQLLMMLDVFYDVLRFDAYQSEGISRDGKVLIDDFIKLVDEALSEKRSAGSLRIDPKVDIICEIPETLPRITAEKEWLIRAIRLMVMSVASAPYLCSKILIKTEVDGGDRLDIFVIGNPNEVRYKFEDLKSRRPFSNIYDSIDMEFKENYENDKNKDKSGFYPMMFAVIHGYSSRYDAEFRTDVSESNSTLILRLPIAS